MAAIRKKLIEALPEADRNAFAEAVPQIRRLFLRRIGIWAGVTAVCTVSAALISRQQNTPLLLPCFVLGISILVLLFLLRNAEEKVKQNPPPCPQPDSTQLAADQAFRSEQEKLRSERSTLLIGALFLFPLIPVFLLIAALRAHFIRQRPGTAACAAAAFASAYARRIRACALFLLAVLCFSLLCIVMWDARANGVVSSLNMQAKQIYSGAEAYRFDLDGQDRTPQWETVIVPPKSRAEEGSIQYGVAQYVPDVNTSSSLWYAVVIGADGSVSEVYCSRSELTGSDLTPPDPKEQRRLASSPFHAREVIGYYREKQ